MYKQVRRDNPPPKCLAYSPELGLCPKLNCTFRHPGPCKFDASCTRHDCTFMHTVSKCSIGDKCSKKCGKRHVNLPGASASSASATNSDVASSHLVTQQCLSGAACWDMSCARAHPVEKCPLSISCSGASATPPTCLLRHPQRCRNNPCTKRPNCKRYHEDVPTTSFASSSASPSSLLGAPTASHSNRNPVAHMSTEALAKEAARRYEEATKFHLTRQQSQSSRLVEVLSKVTSLVGSEASKHASHIEALEDELAVMEQQELISHENWTELQSLVSRLIALPSTTPDTEAKLDETLCRMFREAKRLEAALPALSMRGAIEAALRNSKHRFVIVKGHTGSGKSTQLPQYIADMDEFSGKVVLCTQPRRLAATTLATRVAEEFSASHPSKCDQLRGQVSARSSSGARIRFCIESSLIASLSDWNRSQLESSGGAQNGARELSVDPLANVAVVIVDEAHERNISTDVLIGLLKSQSTQWPDLKVIVTSASLDSSLFLRYLDNCPFIEIPGKTFPVDVLYAPPVDSVNSSMVNEVVSRALKICRNQSDTSGVLCFLTGQEEVEKAKMRFEAMAENDKGIGAGKTIALTLYGRQLEEDQHRVFASYPDKRKVIFATDVAEASITIDGLGFVVDCGMVKENVFDARRNTSALIVRSISKSSADQRKGRAGRTGPGTCYRLYSEDEYQAMAEGVTAEIFCRPLSITVSTLLRMNINPSTFDWIEPPSADGLAAAFTQLSMYGALEQDAEDPNNVSAKLTPLGILVSKLQTDPGVTNMLYYACERGLGEVAANLAGLSGVISMLYWRGGDEKRKKESSEKHASFAKEDGDFVMAYRLLKKWQSFDSRAEASKWCFSNSLNNKAFAIASAASSDIERSLTVADLWRRGANPQANDEVSDADIRRLCMQSQFVNVAVQIKPGVYRTVAIDKEDPSVVGFGHPGSSLFHLHRSGAPRVWPNLLLFQSIFKSSKTFLNQLTPITLDELRKGSVPKKIISAVEVELGHHQPTHICVPNLSSSILLNIVGKYGSKIPTLVEALQCQSIEADFAEEMLSCWCKACLEDMVRTKLEELIQQARHVLRIQAQEEVYKGQTRVVFGSGLAVQNLLPSAQDFVTININELPVSCQQEDVFKLVTGAIRKVDASEQNLDRIVREVIMNVSAKNSVSDRIWAQVRVSDHIWAKKILSALQGEMVGSNTIHVSAGGIRLPSISHSISAHIDIIAATEPLNGCANLFYSRAEDANQVILHSGLHAHAQLPKGDSASSSGGSYKYGPPLTFPIPAPGAPKDSQPATFVVALTGSTRTELELLYYLKASRMPKPTRVVAFRSKPKERKTPLRSRRYGRRLGYLPWVREEASSIQRSEVEELADLQTNFNFLTKDGVHSRSVVRDDKSHLLTIRHFFLSPETAEELYNRSRTQAARNMQRCGQAVVVEPCFTATFSVHQAIALLCRERIRRIQDDFNAQYGQQASKVKATEMGKNVPLEFRFTSRSLPTLTSLTAQWHHALAPSATFENPNKAKLFSLYGRKRMEQIAKTHALHWLNQTQVIYIYSNNDLETTAAKEALNALVQELERYEIGTSLRLERNYANSLRSRTKQGGIERSLAEVLQEEFGRELEIADAQIMAASVLVLTATPETMSQLEKKLEPYIWRLKKKNLERVAQPEDEEECPICFCESDYILQACGHRFCKSCLEDNFTRSDDIHAPLKCPGAGCKMEMTLSDILSVTSPTTLAHLKEDAVYRYVRDSTGSSQNLVVCPSPTCGQILSLKKPSATVSESMLGGHIADCDVCRRVYCIPCSVKEDSAVVSHPGASCAYKQHSSSDSLAVSRVRLLDLVNTRCPACNGVIYDFNGCYALRCQCSAALCGFCLAVDPSGDSHAHVRGCSKNPKKNEYFAPVAVWEALRREDARERLVAALKQRNAEERLLLLESISKDLSDVGICILPRDIS